MVDSKLDELRNGGEENEQTGRRFRNEAYDKGDGSEKNLIKWSTQSYEECLERKNKLTCCVKSSVVHRTLHMKNDF